MKIAAVSKLALRFAPTKRRIVALPAYRSDTPATGSAADPSQEWEYVALRIPAHGVTRVGDRVRFKRLRPVDNNERSVEDCIGKPSWLLRRPGGGQVA